MIMMRGRLVVIATLIAATGVHAAKLPDHSRYDKRIQYVDYNEGDVVVVRSTPGIGTRIVFDAKETIQDMASGFSDGWELVNRANILYLKPRSIKVSKAIRLSAQLHGIGIRTLWFVQTRGYTILTYI